jgi:tripartite-type tricarboxylate transporter receptor subunit TctC
MKRRTLLSVLPAAAAAALTQRHAHAQAYPQRQVRIVVPLAPAGVADILGRLLAERLGALYGQAIVVENRAGASGHVGAQAVAQAAPDGHTLLVGTIGIHAAYSSYRKLTYQPATDLQPVTILGEATNVVLVRQASPFRDFADFLAYVKANPGRVNYGSAGAGSSIHMATVLFELSSGTRMNHVPYKGSGPALVDLIGGQIDVMFENIGSGMTHIQSGKLRPLAVTSAQREPALRDVPTVAEAGVPGYSATSWFTLAVPRGTPAPLVERIQQDVRRALSTPEAVAKFDSLGIHMVVGTPAQAASFIAAETVKWNRVIQAAGLTLD